MSDPASSDLPLFYSAAEPLDKERHASLGFKLDPGGFKFAEKATAVIVNSAEFNFALKNYPLVFTSIEDPQPIAVLGLQRDLNLFVKPDGRWLEGAYVPLYVRRYPFIFGTVQAAEGEEEQFAFCVDTTAPMISDKPDHPFFENGELTDTAQKGIDICQAFQQQHAATQELMKKLAATGLLENREATVNLGNGNKRVLGTYIGIDADRLTELSDEKFLELRREGLLPLIYMHLTSLSNWLRLMELQMGRDAMKAGNQGAAGAAAPANS